MRSTMNVDSILDAVQNIRSLLDTWGITSQVLWLAGLASLALLIFSVREIAGWFLRIQVLRREIQEVNEKLDRLSALVARGQTPIILEPPPVVETAKSKDPSQFRLDH